MNTKLDWAKALGLAGSGCTALGAAFFLVGLLACGLLAVPLFLR